MVRIRTRIAYEFIHQYTNIASRSFRKSLSQVENIQRGKLTELLTLSEGTEAGKKFGIRKNLSWEEFSKVVPVTTYRDWEPFVRKQKEQGGQVVTLEKCERYQPTSGTSSAMKWIPYTTRFLDEVNRSIPPMFGEFIRKNKKILNGRQFQVLSWIPTELRKELNSNVSDDIDLLPWWQRPIVKQTIALPNSIAYAGTSDGSMTATLACLAATRDLAFISVWSPVFALSMFDLLSLQRGEVAEILESGRWGRWQKELSSIPCPGSKKAAAILRAWDGRVDSAFLKALWPNVAMVSSWATSTSASLAVKLENLFPDATFQGKGLFATEGVLTFPFEDRYPLAVTSHFYEFQDLDSGEILPSWGLRKGQFIKPLFSTGAGFFRYALSDRLKVVDFIDQCPCLEFQGRIDGVDLVGEKMSPEIAQDILDRISGKYGITAVSLLAVKGDMMEDGKARYLLLCEEATGMNLKDETAKMAEDILLESFHYRLARDLHQLDSVRAVYHPEARELCKKRLLKKGVLLGNVKMEPLILWDDAEILDIFLNKHK